MAPLSAAKLGWHQRLTLHYQRADIHRLKATIALKTAKLDLLTQRSVNAVAGIGEHQGVLSAGPFSPRVRAAPKDPASLDHREWQGRTPSLEAEKALQEKVLRSERVLQHAKSFFERAQEATHGGPWVAFVSAPNSK